MIKFSIIIPTFNVDIYIEQAIDSVINQNYNEFEIIIVDDGSTDDTIKKCKKYSNPNIKLITIDHAGVSVARNVGINNATGDYLIFLDGDDYLEPFLLESANNLLRSNVDCIIGMFNTIKEKGIKKDIFCENVLRRNIKNKSQDLVLEYLYRLRLIFTVWRFIVKTSIVKNKILFHEGIIHEDEEWVPQMLLNCKTFDVLNKPYYNYRLRKNSLMTSYDNEIYRAKCQIDVAQNLLSMTNQYDKQYQKMFLQRCAYKIIFQSYLTLRKNSSPIKPIKTRKYRIKSNN